MEAERTPAVTQVSLGAENRFAARDFHEHRWSFRRGNPLAWIPEAELDKKTLESEYLFRDRYGRSAAPGARAKLIAMQRAGKLTDADIRSLFRFGVLECDGDELRIRTSRYSLAAGYVLAVIAFTYGMSLLALLVFFGQPSLGRAVAIVAVAAGTSSIMWFARKGWIWPYHRLAFTRSTGANNP